MKNKKQRVLLIANIVWLIIMVSFMFFEWVIKGNGPHVTYLTLFMLQTMFTFASLIIYYLSIMADALSRRTKELEEREKKINKKSN